MAAETECCVITGEVPSIAGGAFHKFFTLFEREIVLEVSEDLLYNEREAETINGF